MAGLGEKKLTKTTPSTSWSLSSLLNGIAEYREKLNLPNPGTFEGLHREVKGRADLTRVLSQNLQVTHSFSMGSALTPPMYNFGAAYIGTKSFLHGTIDTDGTLSARMNYAWNAKNVTKIQAHITSVPGHSMLQLEQDYQGSDYSINYKTINPSPVENTGIYILSYIQSVTQKLALGVETVYQKPTPDKIGTIQASYFQKINEKVEFGTELQILVGRERRDALCTVVCS
ncbi:12965_t:CDS:2 [Racocetra fulgida]|uniref:12965_t:CDS:1 n=1 Tax=Racocetra fulgida TaxID=60492 RepID=A0A9N9FJ22_9GLOM|nr:12965_t:CDS:2 [Racocetra fulgida]